MEVYIKKEDDSVQVPTLGSDGAAGRDLYANIKEPIVLRPHETAVICTGLSMSIPRGYCALVLPISELAINHNIGIINSPGLIDPDYRGEIKIGLHNYGKSGYKVEPGERIAQMIIIEYKEFIAKVVDTLDNTSSDENGLGSSGKF